MQSVNKSDADSRRILDSLRRVVRELRASSLAAERATNLSGAQLFVLRALVREPGLSVSALAERTLTHQSSVSVVVTKLTERGLVERVRAADDGRRLELRPTAKGIRLGSGGPDPAQEHLLAGLALLTPATRRRLADDLTRWTDAIGLMDNAPEMFFEPSRRA